VSDRTSWGNCGGFHLYKNGDYCFGTCPVGGRASIGGQTGATTRRTGLEGAEGREGVRPLAPLVSPAKSIERTNCFPTGITSGTFAGLSHPGPGDDRASGAPFCAGVGGPRPPGLSVLTNKSPQSVSKRGLS